MKRVLMVLPDYWARLQLAHSKRWRERFEIVYASPSNEECSWDFDAFAYIKKESRRHAMGFDGVTSASDYPGAQVAAGMAAKLGLPSCSMLASLTCAHKYYARLACRKVAPEATPKFEVFKLGVASANAPKWGFPCFCKPVKGSFSVQARVIGSQEELNAYLTQSFLIDYGQRYLHTFNKLVRQYTDLEFDGNYALCEGLLSGTPVTIEGWVQRGEVGVIGVTDSIMHRGTQSFARFEYPSALPLRVHERMAEVARRLVTGIGLDNTMWNIEMFYDAKEDRISVIEINPRMASQFADLYEKVEGINGFEIALMLAVGEKPHLPRRGEFKFAASVPLRVFEDMRVVKVPSEAKIAEVEAAHSGTVIWWECKEGDVLSPKEEFEDGVSRRYGVINLGAQSREELQQSARETEAALGASFQRV